jgi:tRNA(Arg) A34 adenosine deaminase TadA
MKINQNIINTLIKVAEANDEYSCAKLASAIVIRNKIISIGINRKKTDPLQAKYGKNDQAIYLHAELHAIKNALREISVEELKGCTLYVVRVKRPNPNSKKYVFGMAKPCCGCHKAIVEFGIKSIVYTTDESVEYISV